jgi:hypothetical protein
MSKSKRPRMQGKPKPGAGMGMPGLQMEMPDLGSRMRKAFDSFAPQNAEAVMAEARARRASTILETIKRIVESQDGEVVELSPGLYTLELPALLEIKVEHDAGLASGVAGAEGEAVVADGADRAGGGGGGVDVGGADTAGESAPDTGEAAPGNDQAVDEVSDDGDDRAGELP